MRRLLRAVLATISLLVTGCSSDSDFCRHGGYTPDLTHKAVEKVMRAVACSDETP